MTTLAQKEACIANVNSSAREDAINVYTQCCHKKDPLINETSLGLKIFNLATRSRKDLDVYIAIQVNKKYLSLF